MMAGATSDTAAAGAFAASGTSAKPRGAASACPRVVAAGGRRRCRVVHCDAGGDAQAFAKAASIAALEQFKISADR
ncbi:glutamyl-tRNA reductase 1, chloroplastic-like [Lolium perenne]|uniref:glutamyl-tRNA reductase 1, chloroplastic-like n=1 Tax=Lolium perenne TaxID=4522 RepID=UPI003A991C1F